MPATLRLTGSGVNAVGGEWVSGLLLGVAKDFALRQRLLQFVNLGLGKPMESNRFILPTLQL
jgi:hypothetical protein